ncbi:hypothetical protein [Nocardiopsis sp. CC223A]|uniref:hypothetical protein n=1 Tax=Nocardiopsis sp. CC223A TaxID=3044051 RepID=UPI00278C09BF|nr:hypothetical protein [Nocardiopsis sp. CC223A]
MSNAARTNERLCTNLHLFKEATTEDPKLKERLDRLKRLAKDGRLRQSDLDGLLRRLPPDVREKYRNLFLPGTERTPGPVPSVYACPEDLCPRTVPVERAKVAKPRCDLQDRDMDHRATML